MLKDITWTHYLITAGALILVYYTTVILLYYRKEVAGFLNRKDLSPEPEDNEEQQEEEADSSELMDQLANTVRDIKKNILVAGNEATKEELLEQLKECVANFGGLSRPAYRYALNNNIIANAQDICGVAFSVEELEVAWTELPR